VSPPLVDLKHVSRSFGALDAVKDVSLSIDAGTIHCLLGPSGSGKSTLLRLIAGLERPTAGEILINGISVSSVRANQPPELRSVGFVFQDYALFPHLTALENVLFGMSSRRSQTSHDRAVELLTAVGLGDRYDGMPHTLSGGEQQRVALARAMARTPSVMLLDEPFSGLDVHLRKEVREQTLSVLKSAGVATLLVTHDPQEALACGDYVSIIANGSISASDSADRIMYSADPRSTAGVFGVTNSVPAHYSDSQITTPLGALSSERSIIDGFVMVRPETLELLTDPEDARGVGVPCTIDRITPEGSTVLYHVTTQKNLRLLVRCLSTERPAASGTTFVRLR